jgi:hypothetical protein
MAANIFVGGHGGSVGKASVRATVPSGSPCQPFEPKRALREPNALGDVQKKKKPPAHCDEWSRFKNGACLVCYCTTVCDAGQ